MVPKPVIGFQTSLVVSVLLIGSQTLLVVSESVIGSQTLLVVSDWLLKYADVGLGCSRPLCPLTLENRAS